MATRKRRVRSPHPGVKLKKRALAGGGHSWRAVYADPTTGRDVYETLDRLALPTAAARVQWAKAKAVNLARTRLDRRDGIRAPTSVALSDGIERYMAVARSTLKPKTIYGHELAHRQLASWARSAGVRETGDLTRPLLVDLRDHLIQARRLVVAQGGRRGGRVAQDDRRAPRTINRELASLKTLFGDWRLREMLNGITSDDIKDALAALPVAREEPDFLSPSDLQALFAAAVRHDGDTFSATRREHAGAGPIGATPRYTAIAPFLAFVLLTGLRRSEALAVTWEMIDLDALDNGGQRVGEIRLPARSTKTNRARTIGLEVSPALRKILASHRLRTGGRGSVFELNGDIITKAQRRLEKRFGAPRFTWQMLRSTCATYLTNAPGIFGAASAFLSARQLGHGVAVAEKHYTGLVRGIRREARTLEAAMQIEDELAAVLRGVSGASAERAAR